ncbi:ABC transporter ATP-binding protein [Paenibacillus sp. GCM10012306]|uniref:ABC transporter ATP-binding protein n=1 Tax=Paenibacillus sp. GCM10012306 TaxID=3317342 RepID=UPI00361C16B3
MDSSYIMQVEDLVKTHSTSSVTVNALQKLTMSVKKGEFIVIMGTSGSGKSTLLNIIGGLDSPTSGRIFIGGMEISKPQQESFFTKYRRSSVGIVFQSYNLIASLTVEENVALPLVLDGQAPSQIKNRVESILELVGLSERGNHRPFELSGGQQQRVALARAVVKNPEILLADEPTGNLDHHTTTEVMELLLKLKRNLNQTILLVTHDPLVASYGDRILFMSDGQIKNELIVKDVAESERNRMIIQQLYQTDRIVL